jgi:hypothetical protein
VGTVVESFRVAAEAGDIDAIAALLADDVEFTSPVAFKPYPGKAMTVAILRGVWRVFEDFHYTRVIESADGIDHALVFETTVSGKLVNGCDFLHVNDAGLIDRIMVMVRPLSGAQALSAAMAEQFPRIAAEASAS